MEIARTDRIRMERAHVHAWPARRSVLIDGWLWRSSGGGSQRANSVSTIDFQRSDPLAAIEEVERRCADAGLPVRFQTFDESQPPELPTLLRQRGYGQTQTTITMFKRIAPASPAPNIEVRNDAWTEWLSVYLNEITESRRAANTEILKAVPAPRAFLAARRNGRLASTALCVVSFGCAVIECVATAKAARRLGAARDVLTALEAWAATQPADLLGLQVVSTNAPAVALYEGMGYAAGATNHFWMRD